MISARTASPFRSTNVTSISSTMHLRVSPSCRPSLHVDLSSAAHWPTNCPCKDHLCSSGKSVIVIFSTTLPRLLARNRRRLKPHHPQPSIALCNSFLNDLLRPIWRTSVNGFCADSRTRKDRAVEEP